MRRPSYFVLAALLDGPLHGYAIAQRAGEMSLGEVRLSAGTLYGAIDRLTAQGLIVETAEEVVAGRRRRYHKLTPAGRDAVQEEAARLRVAADAVQRPSRTAAPKPAAAT